jgi:hypothetical protein
MPVPEPFTPIPVTAGILTNLATDILAHHAQSLAGTMAGRILQRAGLIEPSFEDRLHKTLRQALEYYFATHPDYQLSGVVSFFSDSVVARQIGGYILDRNPVDKAQIQEALVRHLSGEKITIALGKKKGLEFNTIIPDFLTCYRHVISQQLSVPQIALLQGLLEQTDTLVAEIQASEARMQTFISRLLEERLSPQARQAAYQASQQELAYQFTETMDAAGLVHFDQATATITARLTPSPALFDSGLCRGHPLRVAPDYYVVAHGFEPDTLADWRGVLADTLAYADGARQPLKPYFIGDTLLGGYRLCAISEKLCTTRFSVFLLPPSEDRNVYLELGIAIGLGAPFFLIQHHAATIPPVLESLGRYTRGGMFRTMRRELAGQIEEYDFGVVCSIPAQPAAPSPPRYIIAAGDLIEDEDFAGAVTDAITGINPRLEAVRLNQAVETTGWMLDHLVETIQTAQFGIYRVDAACSPTTFLALGISIGLNRPFVMVRRHDQEVPHDLQGMGIYAASGFVTLEQELIPRHQAFFEKYAQ